MKNPELPGILLEGQIALCKVSFDSETLTLTSLAFSVIINILFA
jgi:hypothetical protein